jgi:hypothetical protein
MRRPRPTTTSLGSDKKRSLAKLQPSITSITDIILAIGEARRQPIGFTNLRIAKASSFIP